MLANRIALVTGGTTGIGRAIVEKLASQGATVIFNGFPGKESIEEISKKIKSEYSVEASYIKCDMRKPDEIDNMIDEGIKRYRKIDILVNNAGIARFEYLKDAKLENINDQIGVNLVGPILACRKVIPNMLEHKWGRIINIASIAGLIGFPTLSVYCSTKHGLNGLTKTLALELARNDITVNSICPGFVDTPLVDTYVNDLVKQRKSDEIQVRKSLADYHPTKRIIEPHEIAWMALYLCGDEAKNITGACYNIDGGYISA